jgi:DNA uptake protein ComE-like DNA-binding protein
VDELLGLPGINLDQARLLVSQRERRRFFSSVEEVGELLQLQPHQVEKIRSRIVISALPGGGRRIDY